MRKINYSAFPSLCFALVFAFIAVLRFDNNEWIDTLFYGVAVLGFLIMFFVANRKER